jgi:hypothetical protein
LALLVVSQNAVRELAVPGSTVRAEVVGLVERDLGRTWGEVQIGVGVNGCF